MCEETIGSKHLRVEILTIRSQKVGREGDAHYFSCVWKIGGFRGEGGPPFPPPLSEIRGGVYCVTPLDFYKFISHLDCNFYLFM